MEDPITCPYPKGRFSIQSLFSDIADNENGVQDAIGNSNYASIPAEWGSLDCIQSSIDVLFGSPNKSPINLAKFNLASDSDSCTPSPVYKTPGMDPLLLPYSPSNPPQTCTSSRQTPLLSPSPLRQPPPLPTSPPCRVLLPKTEWMCFPGRVQVQLEGLWVDVSSLPPLHLPLLFSCCLYRTDNSHILAEFHDSAGEKCILILIYLHLDTSSLMNSPQL